MEPTTRKPRTLKGTEHERRCAKLVKLALLAADFRDVRTKGPLVEVPYTVDNVKIAKAVFDKNGMHDSPHKAGSVDDVGVAVELVLESIEPMGLKLPPRIKIVVNGFEIPVKVLDRVSIEFNSFVRVDVFELPAPVRAIYSKADSAAHVAPKKELSPTEQYVEKVFDHLSSGLMDIMRSGSGLSIMQTDGHDAWVRTISGADPTGRPNYREYFETMLKSMPQSPFKVVIIEPQTKSGVGVWHLIVCESS
ncbi:MAG: hypothetical protein AABX38_04585 [Candidatus Micrarchaeota archaeon]